MVVGLQSSTYAEKLAEVGLTSLADRRVRGDVIQVWKYLHGICPYDHLMLQFACEKHDRTTRHTVKPFNLVVPKSQLDIRKNFFTSRAVRVWNQLPSSVQCLDDLNMFKNEYDKLVF